MRRRVVGGIAGWIIGALPLIAVNIATYSGFYIDNPVLIGATALLAGLILGGITTGYIGGRPGRWVSGGAIGAGISGGISALLFAVSIIALVIFAPSLGGLPEAPADQLVHDIIAVLFCSALLLGISMLTGVFAGKGRSEEADEEEDERQFMMPAHRSPSHYQNQVSMPRQPNRMYNNPETSSRSMPRNEARRSQPTAAGRPEGYRDNEPPAGQGEYYYDDRRYQATRPGHTSGPRYSDRDPRSR
jgi:hypothetical protein